MKSIRYLLFYVIRYIQILQTIFKTINLILNRLIYRYSIKTYIQNPDLSKSDTWQKLLF